MMVSEAGDSHRVVLYKHTTLHVWYPQMRVPHLGHPHTAGVVLILDSPWHKALWDLSHQVAPLLQ